MSLALAKDVLRREALARRDGLSPDERAALSAAFAGRLGQPADLPFAAALAQGPVSVFLPIRSEIDTRPLIHALHERGIPVALPVMRKPDLVFRLWSPSQPLVKAAFGLLEPGPEAEELRPRLMLVPLAAFDRRGHRIGYGAGFYDRAIAGFDHDGLPLTTVGLAFACQEVDHVPAEPHDRRLDWILTERGLTVPDPS